MAWKLKKLKATTDESADSLQADESPNTPVSAAQFDRPAGSNGQDSDYAEYGSSERTVMLLNDSDYIPGLIPGAPQAHDNGTSGEDSTDLFPVASDEDLDRYLRGEHAFDPNAQQDEPSEGHDIGAHAVDLDAPTSAHIELDDPIAHSEPIDLDPIPVQPSAHMIDFDAMPETTPSAAADEPAMTHVDLDDTPTPAAKAVADFIPSAAARIDLIDDDEPAPSASIDLDAAVDAAPHVPAQPTNGASGAHKPIDAPDDDSDFFASALNATDDAVASFRSASTDDSVMAPAHEAEPVSLSDHDSETLSPGASPMENWDLDAFAPYQPPGGAGAAPPIAATSTAQPGSVPADETLAGASAVSRLVVRLGQFSASYELIKGETTIGRPDPRTSVFPDVAVEWDDAVSRNHCRVLHKADGDYVEDTGSTNGTRLNDKPLAPYQPILLGDGDRIGVGEKTEISYLK